MIRLKHSRRRYLVETLLGILMIPLTFLPIYVYLNRNDAGYLMYLRARYDVLAPGTPALESEALAAALQERRSRVAGVPVLVYHGVGRGGSDAADAEYVLSRGRFAEQMRSLVEGGYTGVTTRDLARYLASGDDRGLPDKPVLVTFDDGRSDAMIQADRVLADTGMRATMFVIGEAPSRGSF